MPIEIACDACGRPLQTPLGAGAAEVRCAACSASHLLELFPVFWRNTAAQTDDKPRMVSAPDQASCFFHASNEAVAACGGCGRFICELCRIDFQGSMLCPACIQAGFRKGAYAHLDNKRVLYDDIALFLSIIPVFMWPIAVLTAPATIFLVIRFWRAPLGLARRSRIRFVVAFILSLAQICALAALLFWIFINSEGADFFQP